MFPLKVIVHQSYQLQLVGYSRQHNVLPVKLYYDCPRGRLPRFHWETNMDMYAKAFDYVL